MAQSNAFSITVNPVVPGIPSYISSMSPLQRRALSGSYAPTNGTTSLVSVMPSMWTGLGSTGTNIINPWSGGGKSLSGTKMYVHGGGHGDSSNNGLYSFDFNGTTRPTGWAVENQGATGVTNDISVGATGAPISVHTYDGMVDVGSALYRIGGASYPNGFFTAQMMRFDKGTSVWTRIPNFPGGGFGGGAVANIAAGKILVMERWATYQTYAFYRVATNNWSSSKSASNQWPNYFTAAYNSATNVGLAIDGGSGFSFSIDWSAETIVQTSRSLTSMGEGAALVWDATAGRFWRWGGGTNTTTLHEINPSNWSVTAHTLTGDSTSTEGDYHGTYGRFVFFESWRAIGTVNSLNGAAFVIRLPT